MPPDHQRADPVNPGRPQPLDAALLTKVLARNYYKVCMYKAAFDALTEQAGEPAGAWREAFFIPTHAGTALQFRAGRSRLMPNC